MTRLRCPRCGWISSSAASSIHRCGGCGRRLRMPTQPRSNSSSGTPLGPQNHDLASGNGLREARNYLQAITKNPTVQKLGPVIAGRELLLQAYRNLSDQDLPRRAVQLAVGAFSEGEHDPPGYEYINPEDARLDGAIWRGVALGLLGKHAESDNTLSRALQRSLSLHHPQVVRCYEELAGLAMMQGDEDRFRSLLVAAATYAEAGSPRKALLTAKREFNTRTNLFPNAFLEDRMDCNPQSPSVLGSSSAARLAETIQRSSPGSSS